MSQIMIIDDAQLTREALAKLLQYEGFTACTAPNGRDAYAMLYTESPQLIILDLMMPQMDGLTFLRLLRHSPQWENVPVVVMTGYVEDTHMIQRAKALGVVDVLSKGSSDLNDLLNHVREIVPPRAAAKIARSAELRSNRVSTPSRSVVPSI
jgi:chemosensory pili system protein ChpA (sensor histidine kinase/response regulator)